MNKENLHNIFANYIKKFECINNAEHDENYKWRIAARFHDLINPDNDNFLMNLKEACRVSGNLIDSVNRYCFSSLVKCAEKDETAVRNLFRTLFVDDRGNLKLRQKKIEAFIKNANTLTETYVSVNGMFMNDYRSVMGYLFLNDPDRHYLYKALEAKDFASCIEFYDDWGSGSDFNLEIYYRMCDMLVKEIRNCDALMETNASRFIDKEGKQIVNMHPDTNLHILAFDIIYGAPGFRYDFYDGIPFSTITAKARKLHHEKTEKAKELYEAVQKAQANADLLKEAKKYFAEIIHVDSEVWHKMWGIGRIVEINGDYIFVRFSNDMTPKKFQTLTAFDGGYLNIHVPGIENKLKEYHPAIVAKNINGVLKNAKVSFAPYAEYLAE